MQTLSPSAADHLARQLQRDGYSPSLRPCAIGWSCMLFNNVLNGLPQAEGPTLFAALDAARQRRDEMVAAKVYAKRAG